MILSKLLTHSAACIRAMRENLKVEGVNDASSVIGVNSDAKNAKSGRVLLGVRDLFP